MFATAGSNRVTIYECLDDGSVKALQAYVDPEPEEVHYTCAWSYEPETLDPLLAVAGRQGIIRILRPTKFSHDRSMIGHGQAINELKFHPKDPNLLLSISADHAVRFWNVKTQVCFCIFGGEKGHRDEVLSADFNLEATKIISCGMDHSLKIWDVSKPEIQEAMKKSYEFDKKDKRAFKIFVEHFPIFSTCAVHRNYVDCARWMGDLILSKSTDNQIVCWKPGGEPRIDLDEKRSSYLGDAVTLLHKHEYSGCNIWYVRFCIDPGYHVLAVGNQEGTAFVWDLRSRLTGVQRSNAKSTHYILKHARCTTTVRQIGMSNDGRILICVCDDGTLWRWNRPLSGMPESDIE